MNIIFTILEIHQDLGDGLYEFQAMLTENLYRRAFVDCRRWIKLKFNSWGEEQKITAFWHFMAVNSDSAKK